MPIRTIVHPEYTILHVPDHFRYAERTHFKAAVANALKEGCRRVIVDLADVNFIDSTALSVLAMTAQAMKQEQRTFGLLRPREPVLKLLTISGIHKMMPIYQSEREVLATHSA
ncbi:MAG TPA: STAS domain-containing protein [Nitrospira sp.]|nr:STAS domain-containing protein [Nitrospira sp.]